VKRSPLTRKTELVRTEMKRKAYAKRAAQGEERRLFREWANAHRVCMNPLCAHPTGPWQAHHVVYDQHLRAVGLPKFDARNALRLCDVCHARHHNRTAVLLTKALTDTNLRFIVEVYSPAWLNPIDSSPERAAAEYLDRYYDSRDDPRMEALRA